MPKSLEARAEEMARDVMRRSAVMRASSVESDSWKGLFWRLSVAGVVGSPALTRLRPMERRSSSLV